MNSTLTRIAIRVKANIFGCCDAARALCYMGYSTATNIGDSVTIVSAEIQDAIRNKKPLIALDTSILSSTLDYPANKNIYNSVLQTIRINDVIPAPVGVIDGKICVGISSDEVEFLANMKRNTNEASRRDLSLVISNKRSARIRLSAALAISNKLNIKLLVSGSLGGVLPRGNDSDNIIISTELTELGRTGSAVVCAGFRPNVDVVNTSQYLSTEAITTIAYRYVFISQ